MIKSDLINYRITQHELNNIMSRYPKEIRGQWGYYGDVEMKLYEYQARLFTIKIVDNFMKFVKDNIGSKEASVLMKLYIFKETEKTYTVIKACEALGYSKSSLHENIDKWIKEYNKANGLYWLNKYETSL